MSLILTLGFIAAAALLYAASRWLAVSRRIEATPSDEAPAFPVHLIQSAAAASGGALGMSAIVLIAAWAVWHF